MFPADNEWNRDISADPVDPNSAAIIADIDANAWAESEHFLHADFGSNPAYGIPFVVVPSGQSMVPIRIDLYPDESDSGPYPVPSSAPIEVGGDHHVLVLEQGVCRLYEMWHAAPNGAGWSADQGSQFDLNSNALRPNGWTSADEAGLPILPGLTRYDEVAAGEIRHALRFTVNVSSEGWVAPATHPGYSSTDHNAPPMGARMRLRADFDLSPYHGGALVILRALKRYGMFVADSGNGNWYLSGATDPRWNDDDMGQLRNVPGTAFEVVRMGPVQHW